MDENTTQREQPQPQKPALLDRIVTIVLLAICILMAYLIAKPLLAKATAPASDSGSNQAQENIVNVTAITVQPSSFVQVSTMGAEIESSIDSQSLYSTDVAGTLTALDLTVGQTIQQGQVIGTVDPSSAGEVYKPTDIKATIGGTIYSVDSYVGQKITTSTSLATVGSSGELEVVANIAERYLSTLSVGMKATFTTSAWPNEPYNATVKTISPDVNTTNRTVKTTLSIDNPDDRLKEGMYVTLNLTIDEEDNVIAIPSTALTTYLGENVVYIVDGDSAKRVNVTLGSANDTSTVITEGLNAGDMLITAGSVTDGTKVSVVK